MKKLLFVLIAIFAGRCSAQDAHFTQFYESAPLRNPALTGIFSDDYKICALYRDQWASVATPFRTGQVSAEGKFQVRSEVPDYLSIGLLGYMDRAGQIGLQTTGVYGSVSYNKSLEDEHSSYLSVAFSLGYLQRSFDPSKMTLNSQYQSPGSTEQIPFAKSAHGDVGAGVSFNSSFGEGQRSSYILGLAGYHFTTPSESFFSKDSIVNLQMRWNASADLNLGLSDRWSLILHGNYMQQGAYRETVAGGLLKWSKSSDMDQPLFSIQAGAFYRLGDAVCPVVRVEYRGQTFGVSYDVNTSSLRAASGMRGGLEFSVTHSGLFRSAYLDRHACPRF